jgi:hypothetical protein
LFEVLDRKTPTYVRKADTMRFMMMLKSEEGSGPPEGPSQRLMEEMGNLMEEMTKAGILLDTGGLRETAESTQLHWDRGDLTVVDGPFAEAKEVVGGYAIVQAKSREEALEWAKRFVQLHADEFTITAEVREIVEPPEEWT